ncbi:MAG: glycosyltransferase family 4 protein, partial [Bdellovibrionales bacterium]|nr:glycosyltransferase family 4 protein [Bdellovibrionales bacterium]
PEELELNRLYQEISARAQVSDRINVHGYISRSELIKTYLQASVAVEAMEYNLERDLAFTTRTIEYLWCGLPVLYNDYAEISGHIAEYDAGWLVKPDDRHSIGKALQEIFSNPRLVEQKGRNATCLVADRFSWDKTILPLVRFLENPTKAPAVQPAYGAVYAKPSYLAPRGRLLDAVIPADGLPRTQRLIVPAEHLAGIEMVGSCGSSDRRGTLSLTLSRPRGRRLASTTIPLESLPESGTICLPFPFWFCPAGGDELELSVRVDAPADSSACVTLQATSDVVYPVVSPPSAELAPRVNGAQGAATPKAIAVSFVPGEALGAYRAKLLLRRAVVLLKQGEWSRVARAVRHRLPRLQSVMRTSASRLRGGGRA